MCNNCKKKEEDKKEPLVSQTMDTSHRIGTIINRGGKNKPSRSDCFGHMAKKTGNR